MSSLSSIFRIRHSRLYAYLFVYFGQRRIHSTHADAALTFRGLSVCLSVCLRVGHAVSPAKLLNRDSVWRQTRVHPVSHVLQVVQYRPYSNVLSSLALQCIARCEMLLEICYTLSWSVCLSVRPSVHLSAGHN